MRQVIVLIVMLAGTGCLRQTAFKCDVDSDCGSGTCEVVGYCSFADTGCPDGRRFGDLSGPNAGKCVGSTDIDAGVDGPIDASIDALIDAPIDAPMCPAAYVAMGTSTYRFVVTAATWVAAEADCADDGFGTHLVVADDTNEVALVDTISTASRTWIGISDRKVPATWRWVTGAVGPVIPDSAFVGDCGWQYSFAADPPTRLQNRDCAQTAAYLCECDLVPPDPNAF